MYGFDVEQDLIAMFSNEIAKEIDNQIINELIISTTERSVCERKVIFEKFNPYVIGFKSKTLLEAGYVYAPYIPMIEQTIIQETDFSPSKEITTRYATQKINSNFYGLINLES